MRHYFVVVVVVVVVVHDDEKICEHGDSLYLCSFFGGTRRNIGIIEKTAHEPKGSEQHTNQKD
jgi:hypothetical protein